MLMTGSPCTQNQVEMGKKKKRSKKKLFPSIEGLLHTHTPHIWIMNQTRSKKRKKKNMRKGGPAVLRVLRDSSSKMDVPPIKCFPPKMFLKKGKKWSSLLSGADSSQVVFPF